MLSIPDNFSDLCRLPVEVLTRIKETLMQDLYVRVESPAQVALFVYGNDTFIIESFLPHNAEVRIVLAERLGKLVDALSGEELTGEGLKDWRDQPTGKTEFKAEIKPHSFREFRGG